MPAYTEPSLKLTAEGAKTLLAAAEARAREIGVGQNIAVVDAGGMMLAFLRMDGAKNLSILSATAKAETAASQRQPTGRIAAETEVKMALATGTRVTNLPGGLPIIIDGQLVGAVGVGSGTGAQDVDCANAGLRAIGAQTFE
ncbi:GlcG/HbpS family heme-binding protein [Frigidibacter sp. MR17.24]|uniref:GlcG/HbpS family heme-binding protein n=1 Tax=Frigidibacter sp. MR17.24 TaxID=3127345 RepID=UPI003012DB69